MGRFHILLPTLNPADAVGNDAAEMRNCLVGAGHEVHVYAENGSRFEKGLKKPEHLLRYINNEQDTLIYHFAVGWDTGLELLRKAKTRRVIRYHNMTTPGFFARYQKALYFYYVCKRGRDQLAEIAKIGCDLYLSNSGYSSEELISGGAPRERCAVLPPLHHTEKLAALQGDDNVVKSYSDGKANILMIGRISPNKGLGRLLEVFSYYHHRYNQDSRLLIVGKFNPSMSEYAEELRFRAVELGIDRAVVFTGEVDDAQLKAFYQVSHAMLMMSEHEGFCVPLVEAMYFRLPIVAYGSTAVPETLGDSAIYWTEDEPRLYAASLDVIVKDPEVARNLCELQYKRYKEEFSSEVLRGKFLKAIGDLI